MKVNLDMRFILQGISEKERANIQRAAQRQASTATGSTNNHQPPVTNHESDNPDELEN